MEGERWREGGREVEGERDRGMKGRGRHLYCVELYLALSHLFQ